MKLKPTTRPGAEPYWCAISRGLAIGYRKGTNGGTWIARHFAVGTGRRKASLGVADDHEDADGIRVLSFDQAQERARTWVSRMVQEENGEIASGPYTVAEAMADYVNDRFKVKRKPQNRTKAIINAHIIPALGHIDVSKLRIGTVKAWRDSLAEKPPRLRTKRGKKQAYRGFDEGDVDAMRKRQATANRILTVLKAALNFAKSEGRIGTDLAWKDAKPFRKVDVPKIRFLTDDEVKSLISHCEPDFALLVKGALLTGARYGELTALRVENVDLGGQQIYVAESKNGDSRYVDLNNEGVELFRQVIAGRDAKEHVFVRSNSKPWKTSEQFRPMNAACEAAKIEECTFHILRHTYASHAVMAGLPIAVLAEHLGHKDTRITERHYAHFSQGYRQMMVRQKAPGFGF
ncbi:tyrosine-type recombinase/integrase [Telmatobacter sp. DSM 110680]|uniref:Tyrosine-type recombinase/integrase n=1 Tax=Telmatobacter sp. DSM 110680 TaxID=3036704 RepID=A0AAU7DP50_9BACT